LRCNRSAPTIPAGVSRKRVNGKDDPATLVALVALVALDA
jgi:hypothetical protein